MRDMAAKGRGYSAHGELSKMSKLTVSGVCDIREKYASGNYTQQRIAEEYGVSDRCISLIVNKRTWRLVA